MKKVLSIVLVLSVLLLTAACGATEPKKETFSVTDFRGVQVTLNQAPQKIISLLPSNTEIIFALGAGDKLIAVSEYCNYPEDANKKEKLPTGEKLNIESLISLKPDLVILGKMDIVDDQIKQIEDSGIKVVVTDANDIEGTYKVIELIGKIIGRDNDAKNLVSSMKKGFDDIKKEVQGKTGKTVYVEVSPLEYGLWSCGKDTFVQELIELVGSSNIFADTTSWTAVSEEQVIERNPDVIFTTASPLTGINDPTGEILGRQNWANINAIKNNQVYMLDADILSRPGPRLVEAAKAILTAIYQ